ncbi:hypothetical protein FBY35_6861 [Streptomyces sp. SLBN-118]|uniref:hypothetical protein n=1 Tax=Streptomyces sp. SLBN-118 TaxID=2768454 RepID=UPI0011517436|nr:hypothetical protein [Streptomyces sp. SLBN-118]TQK45301.1 hypothetical protein FBY35_6861 [Streptomyces sp. SLBN-118]
MTQSGQGDEQQQSAARPAHEGVVLPADGSEPLIPGVSGAQASPAGGRPWGEPWGPRQDGPGAPGMPDMSGGQGAQGTQGGWGEAPQPGYGGQPMPQGQPSPAPGPEYGGHAQPRGTHAFPPHGPASQGGYDAQPSGESGASSPALPPAGAPAQGAYGAQPLPPQGPPAQAEYGSRPQPAPGAPAPGGYGGQPLSPQGPAAPGGYPQGPATGAEYGTQVLPPQPGAYGAQPQPQPQPHAQPQPQPLPDALPPHAAVGADSDATQYIPPVAPGGPLPQNPAESTQFLGALPGPGPASGSDADATQYIAPVPPAPTAAPFGIRPGAPGDRQPPAEFDSLFRTDAPGAQTPGSTQQLPRVEAPRVQFQQQQRQQQQYQQPQYEPDDFDPEPRARRSSRMPVIAAVVVGCAVLGLGVSMVMFSGDDKKDDSGTGKNVAATSPVPSNSPQSAADPAKAQAEALDKLLADSNNSRSVVIRSVENIKRCEDLDQATSDLQGAAQQRRGLVTRLGGLTVDKLPSHAELTSALTRAWQASASADDHYAAWAQQVKGKKGCKDDRARNTGQTALANRASGEASKAKKEASGLWNDIADKYGLTKRRSDQL